MAWRLAASLDRLRDEVDDTWPGRSKVSDGTIGDSAHAARRSDHNPNSAGVVRALDITAAGIDADRYAEHLRTLGAAGHTPLRDGGYILWDRQQTSAKTGWAWRPYGGANPHTKHIHVSVGASATAYDSPAPWRISTLVQEDFMATLSEAEQRELLTQVRATALLATSVNERCARLETSIHGTTDETRANSIWWQVEYLWGELLKGDNVEKLRRLLDSA